MKEIKEENDKFLMELNGYQITNLKTMMEVIKTVYPYFDTGDWFGEIYNALASPKKINFNPNVPLERQIQLFEQLTKYKRE